MSARTLLYDGLLYFLKNNAGILSAFDATSGRPHYQAQRIDGIPEVYSSPVAAQGRVYITGRDGTTVVSAALSSIADSMVHFVCPSWARRWDALTRANADVGTSARR